MPKMYDNYYDHTRQGSPYTHSHPALDGTFPASNAVRGEEIPTAPEGFHPGWNGKKWGNLENHVGKQGYVAGESVTIKEYGSLPDGWSDTPPPLTPEEQAEQARATRDGLLRETDTLVLVPDISEEFREAVKLYRQTLRDLPEQSGWPTDIVWPERP